MKRAIFSFIALISLTAHSQISSGGAPTSFNLSKQNIIIDSRHQVKAFNKPDLDKIQLEDDKAEKQGKPYRAAVNIEADIDINSNGTWTGLSDGSKLWRLSIKIADAKALGIYFSTPLQIPSGGKLHAYNANHSQFVGAFTEYSDNFTALEMIQGDVITLEYFMPANQTELPIINIGKLAYFYRGVGERMDPFKEGRPVDGDRADACQVDVACSETIGWEPQRDAVVKYTFMLGTGTFLCTGAITNNTAEDCKPYILTANHCGEPTNSSDIQDHIWYFNYQRPNCDPGNTSPYNGALSQTMSGGFFRASSELGTHPAANNNQVAGSDFALLELSDSIPTAYNPYYAGWSKTTANSPSGVGIHHPSGDEKKISTYNSSLSSATYNGGWASAHWEVTWVSTSNGHGVTEGGSSGSPIYNSNGKIVGHLSGGSSFCAAPNQTDLYGKFQRAWSLDGNSTSSQLQSWLDPINSGVVELDGSYTPCAGTSSGYCQASSVDCDEYIKNVSLGGIANPTACTNYNLYWQSNNYSVEKGSTYFLEITPGIIGDNTIGYDGDQIAAWIDWNGDGDFTDANEQVYTHTIDANSTSPLQTIIAIPTSAAEQQTRMRVRITYDVATEGLIEPCGVSNYGEVEDYVFSIVPSSVSISENSTNQISIYPNPTNGLLNIDLKSESTKQRTIEIFDLVGKTVLFESSNSNILKYDLSNFNKGVYTVRIKSENDQFIQKIVIR